MVEHSDFFTSKATSCQHLYSKINTGQKPLFRLSQTQENGCTIQLLVPPLMSHNMNNMLCQLLQFSLKGLQTAIEMLFVVGEMLLQFRRKYCESKETMVPWELSRRNFSRYNDRSRNSKKTNGIHVVKSCGLLFNL